MEVALGKARTVIFSFNYLDVRLNRRVQIRKKKKKKKFHYRRDILVYVPPRMS